MNYLLEIATNIVFFFMDYFRLFMEYFFISPLSFFSGLTFQQLVIFFLPAICIDIPRYVLSDLIVFLKTIFFPDNYRDSDFADLLYGPNQPLLSILLPGYNEEESVGKTIDSFLESSYKNIEIIAVSDGSNDRMNEVCQQYASQGKIRYFVHHERCGKSAAANYALKMAKGDFIVIADADTTYDYDALHQIMLPFADPEVGGVSANLRVRNWKKNYFTKLQALEYIFSIGMGRRFSSMFGFISIVSGAFGAFRKEILLEIGGWEPGPGEDADITVKIRKTGCKIVFTPKSMCMTDVPDNPKSYWKQRLRWNRSLIRLRVRKHNDVYFRWHDYTFGTVFGMVDSVFFQLFMPIIRIPYYLMVGFYYTERGYLVVAGTIYFYTITNFFKFAIALALSERRREDIFLIPLLPFFTFFKLFETFDRLWACFDEFLFETSFTDPYVPTRVLNQAKRKW